MPIRSERTRGCSTLSKLRAPAFCSFGSELAAPPGFQQRGARSSASFQLQRQAPQVGREVASSTHGAQAAVRQRSTSTLSSGQLACPSFLTLGTGAFRRRYPCLFSKGAGATLRRRGGQAYICTFGIPLSWAPLLNARCLRRTKAGGACIIRGVWGPCGLELGSHVPRRPRPWGRRLSRTLPQSKAACLHRCHGPARASPC